MDQRRGGSVGGKNAVSAIRKKYPALAVYQSEQECGDGKNDWNYAGIG